MITKSKTYEKPFKESVFDLRKNTEAVTLDSDILMFINEYVEVIRDGNTTRLVVSPITYDEYSRIMAKPYKRPMKNKAWRLINNVDGKNMSEIIIGPCD